MKFAYMIMALNHYSASYAVCCFSSQASADLFIKKIEKHESIKPEPISEDVADDEFDLWESSWNRWKNRHPAGAAYSDCDGFEIIKIEIKERNAEKPGCELCAI